MRMPFCIRPKSGIETSGKSAEQNKIKLLKNTHTHIVNSIKSDWVWNSRNFLNATIIMGLNGALNKLNFKSCLVRSLNSLPIKYENISSCIANEMKKKIAQKQKEKKKKIPKASSRQTNTWHFQSVTFSLWKIINNLFENVNTRIEWIIHLVHWQILDALNLL